MLTEKFRNINLSKKLLERSIYDLKRKNLTNMGYSLFYQDNLIFEDIHSSHLAEMFIYNDDTINLDSLFYPTRPRILQKIISLSIEMISDFKIPVVLLTGKYISRGHLVVLIQPKNKLFDYSDIPILYKPIDDKVCVVFSWDDFRRNPKILSSNI